MPRCKFKCESKKISVYGAEISMQPVTGGSKENESFFKYTPFGSFNMGLISLETAEQFVPGKEYYIDINEAEEELK